ncbi:MAG: FtsX-like permease family protein [Acidobacteriota bacterium]|nr:FtsX-like permease family protein [Acidobacteriota bacterium]
MKYLRFILKSLMRSKRRTLLILSTITLSVFLVTVLQSLLTTLDAISNNPTSSNRLVVRAKSGLAQVLPMSYLTYLKEQPEVESATYLQWFGGTYKDPSNFFANFAADETTLFQVFREEFGTSGVTEAQIQEFVRDGSGCIVGKALADKFGWKVGDVVPLQGTIFPISPRLTIRVVFKATKPSQENALYFHYKVLAEGVPRMKGSVGTFFLRVHQADEIPRLSVRIDNHYANSASETLSETENAFNLSFVKMLGNITAMIQGITAAVLVAILIVTAGTMSIAIRERTTEIAVLRAMGFRTGLVLSLLLGEGLILVGGGGVLGVGLAGLAAGGIRKGMGATVPFLEDFALLPSTMLLCFGITLLVGLLSTFIPAYQATRRPIVEGLRSIG